MQLRGSLIYLTTQQDGVNTMALKQPLSFYTDDKSLRFYLLDVGEGLMNLIVFPNPA